MFQKHDEVVRLDIGFEPEAAVSGPVLLQTDVDAFLTFNAVLMTADSRHAPAGTAVIEFERCSVTKFGYPSDEALGGHPLYKRGLESYGVFEVLSSSWIRQMTEQNRVSFPHTTDSTQRHFIFVFHDSTFECVADSYQATLSTEPYEHILRQLKQRVFHHAAQPCAAANDGGPSRLQSPRLRPVTPRHLRRRMAAAAELGSSGNMSQRPNNFLAAALAAAATLFSLVGCGHSSRVRYQDGLVKVTERSTINFINVHNSSDTEVLTLWGRDYKDVRGRNPCYLSVTNKHLILFVTGKEYDGGQATVHLADVSNRTIRDFLAYDSGIGSNIGATETNRYERVARAEGDKLTIEAAFLERRYKYVIDLATPKFEREEADFEGALPPHKIEHHVYEGGRISTSR
jgi:hypothetical protein